MMEEYFMYTRIREALKGCVPDLMGTTLKDFFRRSFRVQGH